MQVEHLPAPPQLPTDGLVQHVLLVFQHEGLHRHPVHRRFLQHRHIPDAGKRHIQRAGNGGGGQGQHVHVLGKLLELFLVGHAEALLLVHDQQAQILELHVLL